MNMNRCFKIGLIQMACGDQPDENLNKAIKYIEKAASDGAELVCLPELFRTRYLCQSEDSEAFNLAESIPGPSTTVLTEVANDKQIIIVAPLFERRAAGVYHNSIAVIDRNGVKGLYRKMHIPDDPGYYEKYYFTPGDLGFRAFQTEKGCLGTLICWDQWYPEAARLTALQGADVLFYPTAIGWHPSEKEQFGHAQRDAWRIIQRSHAIANGVYVASVNRIGYEPSDDEGRGIEFWGSSFLCDPFGVIMAEASVDQEEILLADIDQQRIEEVRRNWPFLRDRRIDAYSQIEKRFMDPNP